MTVVPIPPALNNREHPWRQKRYHYRLPRWAKSRRYLYGMDTRVPGYTSSLFDGTFTQGATSYTINAYGPPTTAAGYFIIEQTYVNATQAFAAVIPVPASTTPSGIISLLNTYTLTDPDINLTVDGPSALVSSTKAINTVRVCYITVAASEAAAPANARTIVGTLNVLAAQYDPNTANSSQWPLGWIFLNLGLSTGSIYCGATESATGNLNQSGLRLWQTFDKYSAAITRAVNPSFPTLNQYARFTPAVAPQIQGLSQGRVYIGNLVALPAA